jgi:hypothetical protein
MFALLLGAATVLAVPAGAASTGGVRVLVPPTAYAASPSLAVDEAGRALVSWFGGPAAVVSSEPLPGHHHYYVGEKLFAAAGSATGRFDAPVLLAAHASTDGVSAHGPFTALTGSGLGYVAWRAQPGGPIMITSERNGHFAMAHEVLRPSDQLVALASGGGPVVAVWATFPPLRSHQHSSLEYARVLPDGSLGRAVELSALEGDDAGNIAVSINSTGAIALAWVRGLGDLAGSRVRVVACDPAMSCTVTPSLALFPTWPHYGNVAVSLDDGDRLTVLADDGPNSATRAATATIGGPFRVLPGSIAGTDPLAATTAAGTIVVTHGSPDRVETIPANARRLSPGAPLDGLGAVSSLNANPDGSFVAAAPAPATAALGGPPGVGDRVERLTPGATFFVADGIAGHGNALVVWDEFLDNQVRGLFLATYRA